jgi:hypothetical protein
MTAMLSSALLIVQLAAPAGQAQAQTPQVAEAPLVKPEGLPTVFLTDRQGVEHRGKLIRVEPGEVVLLGDTGQRVFERSEIAKIEKRGDSLKNGALIGAAVGVLAAVSLAGLSDCPGMEQDGCPGARVAMSLITVGVYTAIGVGIDAAIQGRTLIYRAPGLTVSAGPSRASAGINIRW